MDLKVMIEATVMKAKKNYFIMLQLDELEFPSKNKKVTKYRTELEVEAAAPKFVKNKFTFKELNLGSRITLKLGCFSSPLIQDTNDNVKLMERSGLEGSALLTFTQRVLTVLRETDRLEQDLKLTNRDQEEVGRITLAMQFKPHTFEQMVDENVRKVEQLYYDPFEEDEQVILKKTKQIEGILSKKQDELEEALQKLDYIKTSHKSISVETAHLKRQKDNLEQENVDVRKKLDKLESIKELDIQIDLLQQSDHGVDILREIYAKLMNRMNLERVIYEELSDEYFQIEKRLAEKKRIEAQIDEVKKASTEQDFHTKRNQDMLPGVAALRETIKSQERTIQNLQGIIKENLRKNNVLANREIDVELKRMRHDHQYLQEKNKQLKSLQEMNEGVIPLRYFQQLQGDELLGENPIELKKYKDRASHLLSEIEQISREMEDMTIKDDAQRIRYDRYLNDPDTRFDREMLQMQIDAAENKGDALQKEIFNATKNYAKAISELKEKIINLDAFLATTRNHY